MTYWRLAAEELPSTFDPDAPLLVLLPGLSGNFAHFDNLLERLRVHDIQVTAAPPILESPLFNGQTPLVEDVADVIVAELERIKATNFVLVSHSVGVFVASEIIRVHPADLRGVIALNSGLATIGRFLESPVRTFMASPAQCIGALRLFAIVTIPFGRKVRETVAKSPLLSKLVLGKLVVGAENMTAEERVRLAENVEKPSARSAMQRNSKHWSRFTSSRVPYACPVLLVGGTEDPLSARRDLDEMAANIEGARVFNVVGEGHSISNEALDRVDAELVSMFA